MEEAPEGWHKPFQSFTICGEGECIKTLFTIYFAGKAETWQHRLGQMGKAAVARIIDNSTGNRGLPRLPFGGSRFGNLFSKISESILI